MRVFKLYEADAPVIKNHVYVDDSTGKAYIYDGAKLIELPPRTGDGEGGDGEGGGNKSTGPKLPVSKPQIGKKPSDTSILDKEDKEREEQVRREAEEDGEEIESDEERAERLKRIKRGLDSESNRDMANYENQEALKKEKQRKIKAEKEQALKKKYANRNVAAIQAFARDLKNFVATQVGKEVVTPTWRKYNSNYAGSGLIKQGHRNEKVGKIPLINVYFDQSGSWGANDVEVGMDALASLYQFEKKGLIKLQVYYFSNHLHGNAEDARNEGGTAAGAEMMQHIADTKPMNVIVMTDDDFDDPRWRFGDLNIEVPGAVWLLFRNYRSQKLINQLHGKRRTKIYDI